MSNPENPQRYEIRKYPNRRFYDVTRSRHVTLADLYELVRSGHEIVVTDSATGDNITNIVLTQIILEYDPPKLDLFPASLLHQALQANEQMVRKFIDQYFARAMEAFMQSRRRFDEYLRRSGFSALTPTAPLDWVRMLFPGGAAPESSPRVADSQLPPAPDDAGSVREDPVAALQDQLAALGRELKALQAGAKTGSKKRAKKSAKKQAKKKTKPKAVKKRGSRRRSTR